MSDVVVFLVIVIVAVVLCAAALAAAFRAPNVRRVYAERQAKFARGELPRDPSKGFLGAQHSFGTNFIRVVILLAIVAGVATAVLSFAG
ncbi:MAG: hypothetical protein DI498_05775 [Paracoccus denitrificans]|nr:MAG: hypothetical protein DI498_05775 [Paracoccus denitrificans]PZO84937.1 MAG: hypothetical protein DI633_05775 [Paracoccus denitrificans]